NSQRPEVLRNGAARGALPSPRLKAAPRSEHILWQIPTLACWHRGPSRKPEPPAYQIGCDDSCRLAGRTPAIDTTSCRTSDWFGSFQQDNQPSAPSFSAPPVRVPAANTRSTERLHLFHLPTLSEILLEVFLNDDFLALITRKKDGDKF